MRLCESENSTAALIVGDTLCLGSTGFARGERQNNKRYQIGEHTIEMRAYSQFSQHENAIAVDVNAGISGGNALEETKQDRSACDIQRFPVAEYHNRQREEAEAGDIAIGAAIGGGERVNKSAHTCQRARNGGACIAHFVNVDSQRIGCLRILAAGAQSQTETGLVEDYRKHDKDYDADISREINLVDKGLAEETDIGALVDAKGGFLYHEPACSVARCHLQGVLVSEDSDKEEHQRGSHQVEGGAADGLVSLEVYRSKGEQQRESSAHDSGNKHGENFQALKSEPLSAAGSVYKDIVFLHFADEKNADEGTEYHNTFESEVDDTASLSENACKRYYHQGNSVEHSLLNDKCHAFSPSFPFSDLVSDFLPFPVSSILMTSEKALR